METPGNSPKSIRKKVLMVTAGGAVAAAAMLGNPFSGPSPSESLGYRVESSMDSLFKPLIDAALRKRAVDLKNDPEYAHRIDSELNLRRINFLIFGQGEDYDPHTKEKAMVGSQTILSYNIDTKKFDLISLTHDILAPEIQRGILGVSELAPGTKIKPYRIDRAYEFGGFNLMVQTIEDATGLRMDHRLVLNDRVIKDAVDEVFGGLELEIPFDVKTEETYLDETKYPSATFTKGIHKLNGMQAISFMKALAINYDPKTERNVRKAIVMDALMNKVLSAQDDPRVLLKLAAFLKNKIGDDSIKSDIDMTTVLNTIWSYLSNKLTSIPYPAPTPDASKKDQATKSKIRERIYIVDHAAGDGGVQWITVAESPIIKNDLANGVYEDKALATPLGTNVNPYSKDLVGDYWGSARALVKERLKK